MASLVNSLDDKSKKYLIVIHLAIRDHSCKQALIELFGIIGIIWNIGALPHLCLDFTSMSLGFELN